MTRIILTLTITLLCMSGISSAYAKRHTAHHTTAAHAAKKKVAKKKVVAKQTTKKKKNSSLTERSQPTTPHITHEPITVENDFTADEDLSEEAGDMMREDDIRVNMSTLFDESKNFSPKDILLGEEEANPLLSRADVMMTVVDWLGTPYHYGGTTRHGIDCSAFTQTVYRDAIGVELPRSASMQYQNGVAVTQSELEFGDLVFFQTRARIRVSHVGMYIGGGLFVHAGASGGVTVSALESTYFAKRYIGAKRIVTEQTQTASLK